MPSLACPRFVSFGARAIAAFALLLALRAQAQSLYLIGKSQALLQTSAAAPGGATSTPFVFNLLAPANVPVTRPNGAMLPGLIAVFTDDDGFIFDRAFTTEAARDEAFPDGLYRVTRTGAPALNISLSNGNFASVPRVTGGGTWNPGGVLVVNPTQAVTFTFSPFPEYNTPGAAGQMRFELGGFQDSVERDQEIFSIPFLGEPATPAAFTSHTVPANTLTNGRLYALKLGFARYPTVDLTTAPGDIIGAGYEKETTLFIAALTTGNGGTAPTITTQPSSRTAAIGSSTTFTVASNATGNYIVQWLRNGDEITSPGGKYIVSSNGFSLTINNLVSGDSGEYNARIIATGGVVTSANATLTVPAPPVILAQPAPQATAVGGSATLSAEVTGTGNTYQWRKEGAAIQGATGATLTLPAATAADAGNYSVTITNALGSVTSTPTALTVANRSTTGRLINLSILTSLSSATESLTMGYVVGGTGIPPGVAKPLVIRGAGPSLVPLGVAAPIDDPKLELFVGPQKTLENDNWGGGAGITSAMSAVGAFAFIAPGSGDSALTTNVATGENSVRISSARTSTDGADGLPGTPDDIRVAGPVLAEIYDATPPASFSEATPRLVNVSVLKDIGTGLTAGFAIGGTTPKSVSIRAIGPTLGGAPFNVPGVVANPRLALFSGLDQTNANDDWGGTPALTAAFAQVGAFALPAASRDAALLATLAPGNYTVQVTSADATSGTALIEIYELP